MKKMFALAMAMLLLISNAFAESLFPPLKATSAAKELAPSYSVYAGAESLSLADDLIEATQGNSDQTYGRFYAAVSKEMFLKYAEYLEECGYQLLDVDEVKYLEDTWLSVTYEKGDITFCIWYSVYAGFLMEFYPNDVESQEMESVITEEGTALGQELAPSYRVYTGVEPGMVVTVKLDDGNLADVHTYFDVSIEDWGNYVKYVCEENGYKIIDDNLDDDEAKWIDIVFGKGSITYMISYYYAGEILNEYYPNETIPGTTETNAGSAAASTSAFLP